MGAVGAIARLEILIALWDGDGRVDTLSKFSSPMFAPGRSPQMDGGKLAPEKYGAIECSTNSNQVHFTQTFS